LHQLPDGVDRVATLLIAGFFDLLFERRVLGESSL